jgi:hypothetical protein
MKSYLKIAITASALCTIALSSPVMAKAHADNYTRVMPNGVRVVKRHGETTVYMTQAQYNKYLAEYKQEHAQPISALGSPVASIGAPNAFGSGNAIFMGGMYVNHYPQSTASDGMMNFGVSLGDAHKYLGVVLSTALTSLGVNNDSFGSNGLVGLRINRYLREHTAIAFGMSNLSGWGVHRNQAKSYYGAITQGFTLGLPMTINFGIGSGGFNNPADVSANNDNHVRVFAGWAMKVCKNLSFIVDYATQQLNVGGAFTFNITPKTPLFISLSGNNVNKHDGSAYFQAVGGIAYVFG